MSGLTFDPETLNLRPRVSIAIFPERLVSHLSSKDQAVGQAMGEEHREAPGRC